MISTAELLAAAKSARGIPSNYRLAKVLEATDATLQRWNTGRGCPDDAHAAKLAQMAGLDVEWVVVSMRAQREKDPALRAIWEAAADRLLLTSGMPPRHDGGAPPTSEDGPEGGSSTDDENASGGGALMSSQNAHYAQLTTPKDARLRRIAKASLGRALKAKKAH